mmetsp:Transcript_46314/g.107780  ORF Transcript_46314/g.107780 Transcript_46314/m.107780 type:complete len:245 (+) Transcript_46314:527-1261(+)
MKSANEEGVEYHLRRCMHCISFSLETFQTLLVVDDVSVDNLCFTIYVEFVDAEVAPIHKDGTTYALMPDDIVPEDGVWHERLDTIIIILEKVVEDAPAGLLHGHTICLRKPRKALGPIDVTVFACCYVSIGRSSQCDSPYHGIPAHQGSKAPLRFGVLCASHVVVADDAVAVDPRKVFFGLHTGVNNDTLIQEHASVSFQVDDLRSCTTSIFPSVVDARGRCEIDVLTAFYLQDLSTWSVCAWN